MTPRASLLVLVLFLNYSARSPHQKKCKMINFAVSQGSQTHQPSVTNKLFIKIANVHKTDRHWSVFFDVTQSKLASFENTETGSKWNKVFEVYDKITYLSTVV